MTDEPIDHERDRRQSTSYSTEEILAQALCQASTTGLRRVYAVARSCTKSAGNCHHICSSPHLPSQDYQLAKAHLSCFAAFHVYYNRPSTLKNATSSTARLGLKTIRTSCLYSTCGPNFCCCVES